MDALVDLESQTGNLEFESVELANSIVSKLKGLGSPEGYPYPLKVAHTMATVKMEEFKMVLAALGLELERSGRDVLR